VSLFSVKMTQLIINSESLKGGRNAGRRPVFKFTEESSIQEKKKEMTRVPVPSFIVLATDGRSVVSDLPHNSGNCIVPGFKCHEDGDVDEDEDGVSLKSEEQEDTLMNSGGHTVSVYVERMGCVLKDIEARVDNGCVGVFQMFDVGVDNCADKSNTPSMPVGRLPGSISSTDACRCLEIPPSDFEPPIKNVSQRKIPTDSRLVRPDDEQRKNNYMVDGIKVSSVNSNNVAAMDTQTFYFTSEKHADESSICLEPDLSPAAKAKTSTLDVVPKKKVSKKFWSGILKKARRPGLKKIKISAHPRADKAAETSKVEETDSKTDGSTEGTASVKTPLSETELNSILPSLVTPPGTPEVSAIL
jgi:hypothetical protein